MNGSDIARLTNRGTVIILSGALLIFAQTTNLIFSANFQQYRDLADSFLAGRLDFLPIPGKNWGDSARYGETFYWPLGPFPAVLIAPFAWVWQAIEQPFQQGYANFPLIIWTSYLIFRLAKQHQKTIDDAAWLTLAFIGASSYLSVALVPWSWHLAHVTAVWLTLLTIEEHLHQRRWFYQGLLVGLVFASRQTAGLVAVGIGLSPLFENHFWQRKLSNTARFASGFGIIFIIVLIYNYLRFGSVFESGYRYQLVFKPDGPLFGWWNFWPNLRVFLFNGPIPAANFPYLAGNPLGMSIIVVTPWLLFLRPRQWSHLDSLIAMNIILIAGIFLCWWSTGSNQLGYRFCLDFMPLLLWVILRTDSLRFSVPVKITIAVSVIANVYFLTTIFNG